MVSCKNFDWKAKLILSLISAAIFFAIASPFVFSLVDKLFGGKHIIATPTGKFSACPTFFGLIVHTIVFALIIFLTMEPWKKKACTCDGPKGKQTCACVEGASCA